MFSAKPYLFAALLAGDFLAALCLAVALLTAAFWTDAVFLLPTAFLA